MVLPIKVYVIAASLGTIVYLAIFFRHEIATASDTVCALSPTKKCALAVMLLIAVVFGGGKTTNRVEQTDGTNNVNNAAVLHKGEAASSPLVRKADDGASAKGEAASSPLVRKAELPS